MSNPPRSFAARPNHQMSKPLWLRLLLFIEHSTSFVTFCLVIFTLAVYASVVYSQQQWTSYYEQLKELQRNQRDLTTTNETLRNQLAEQAEKPNMGFVAPSADNTIVLPSSGPETLLADPLEANIPKPEPKPQESPPLGY